MNKFFSANKIVMKNFVILIILYISCSSFLFSKVLIVDNSKPYCAPNVYTSFKEALNHASNGDIIKICKGTYSEFKIDKNINKLTITSGPDVSSINDINIVSNSHGIYIGYGWTHVNNLEIDNMSITSKYDGIFFLQGTNLKLNNIKIFSSKGRGIYSSFSTNGDFSFNNLNIESKFSGIYLHTGKNLIVKNSKIQSNNSNGIYCNFNDDIFLKNLNITCDDKGIYIYDGNKLTFDNITINVLGNSGYGIYTFWDVKNNSSLMENININFKKGTGIKIDKNSNMTFDNITIKNSVNTSGSYGIYINWSGSGKNYFKNLNIDVSGIGLLIRKSEPVIQNSLIVSKRNHAVYCDWDTNNINIQNSKLVTQSNSAFKYALIINNSKNNALINNNCFYHSKFAPYRLAKVDKKGNNFNGNFWEKFSGNIYHDGNVLDVSPLSSCPFGSFGTGNLIADWHFDKCIWNGVANEVKDNTTNHYDGTPKNGVNTTATKKILCRSAFFDGINDYIEVKNLSNILKGTASLSFWIKTTQTGNNIDWRAPGIAGIEEYGGEDDIFWGWIDAHGHIGISKGDNYANSKSKTIINDGQWHHVVLSRNSLTGLVKIYIDGKLDKIGFTDNGIVGTPFSSIGRIENTNNSIPLKYFQGYLDEVKVFNYMLSLSDVKKIYNNEKNGNNWDGTNRECILCAKVDHYEIIHDSTGLTCLPESVEIKACSNKECSTLYTNNVTLQLFPHGWVNGDTKSFSGGIATFKLQHKTKGTVTLGIVSSNPDADYCCRNSEIDNNCVNDMKHCNISFYDDGFIFDINNNYSCTTEQNIKIQAITKDSNDSCIPAFKNKSISIHFSFNYINPSTGDVKPEINNKELNTDVVLNFNDNGTAEFNFKYNDAGEIGVTAIYDNATSYAKGYDSAIFSPKKFIFQGNNSSDNITDSDINPAYNSSCSNDTCWANINKFIKKAGEPFDFKIYAACSDGTITKNYKENVELITQMEAPDKGDNVSTVNINKNDFNNGGVTVNNYVYNDVGIINLIAKHDNYSGSGLNIYGSIKIGRFIPDHFDVEFDNYTLEDNCSSGGFTYLGSKFYYKNTPKITIVAKNIKGSSTLKYKNSFYKLPTSFYVHYFDNTSTAEFDNKSEVYDNDSKLYKTNIYLKNDGFEYKKSVKTSEFEGNLIFKFESIEDSDGVKYGTNGIYTKILNGIHLRYGRFKIFDNYGPDTENLDMEGKVQYWDGDKWILNEDDSCTNVNKNDFYLGDSSIADITDLENISTGKWTITLSPKKSGQTSVCVKSSVPFYQYLIDNDSCGTATFGIYRGRDRIILWKEIPSSQ